MTVNSADHQSRLNDFQRLLAQETLYFKGRLPVPKQTKSSAKIRILSWNIAGGRRPELIAEQISGFSPDVVCLQEVDWGNAQTERQDVLEVLTNRLEMLGLFAIEFFEVASPLRSRRRAGGGVSGNALLTRLQPTAQFRVDLPVVVDWQGGDDDFALSWRVRRRMRLEPRIGHRCGIAADFIIGPHKLVVCSVHFEDKHGGVSGRWSQFRHAVKAVQDRNREPDVAVVAGDFNTIDSRLSRLVTGDRSSHSPGKPVHLAEAAWWKQTLMPTLGFRDPFSTSAWTFRVPLLFREKLDWIAVKGATVIDRGIGPRGSSDHRPIWTDLLLDAQ